jgi:hypothetical protein
MRGSATGPGPRPGGAPEPPADSAGLLEVYLNDHLVGATAGLELFRRSAQAQARADTQRDPEHGGPLAGLARQVEQDRDSLIQIMTDLGVSTDRPKVAMGWPAEKAGCLKPNGRLFSRSPLSDLRPHQGRQCPGRRRRRSRGPYSLDAVIAQDGTLYAPECTRAAHRDHHRSRDGEPAVPGRPPDAAAPPGGTRPSLPATPGSPSWKPGWRRPSPPGPDAAGRSRSAGSRRCHLRPTGTRPMTATGHLHTRRGSDDHVRVLSVVGGVRSG